jgi:pyruvate formate lyase activating enzyme
LNDSSDEIKKFSKWVAGSLGRDTPVHFSRFFPFPWTDVKYETPIETLEGAYRIAKDCGIEYVYIGNVYAHKYESTFCPECDELLIKRVGYNIKRRMKGNRCGCGKKINIVG